MWPHNLISPDDVGDSRLQLMIWGHTNHYRSERCNWILAALYCAIASRTWNDQKENGIYPKSNSKKMSKTWAILLGENGWQCIFGTHLDFGSFWLHEAVHMCIMSSTETVASSVYKSLSGVIGMPFHWWYLPILVVKATVVDRFYAKSRWMSSNFWCFTRKASWSKEPRHCFQDWHSDLNERQPSHFHIMWV